MIDKKTVLMLGDSLIDWGDWEKLIPEYSIRNRGLAGEEVAGLAARLADELLDSPPPEHIFFMSGTNNLLMGDPFFPATFKTMLYRTRQFCPEARITVNAILPMRLPNPDEEAIKGANRLLGEIAREAGGTFFDPTADFNSRCLPITHPCFLEDGVHLSTRGYELWAAGIKRHLDKLEE